MAKVKKDRVIYFTSAGIKHYFQYEMKSGPNVLTLNAKEAMGFTLKGAKAEINERGKRWQIEVRS